MEVDSRWKAAVSSGAESGRLNATFRQKVAKDMFDALLPAERKSWGDKAKAEAAAAKAAYKDGLVTPPSTDPTVRAK